MAKPTKLGIAIVASMIAAGCNRAAEPIALWEGTTVGMTLEEVRRSVPNAQPKQESSTTADGWEVLLTEQDRVGQHDRRIDFLFKDERLMGVTVVEGERYSLSPIRKADVDSVFANLRATYGAPVRCQAQDVGGQACFWLKDGKFIGFMGSEQQSPFAMTFLHKERPGDRDLME